MPLPLTRLRRLLRGAVPIAVALTALATLPAWAQKVRLATTEGDIVLELDAAKAPKTVENFLRYVRAGHYDGTIFHRVIPTFMIQGGGLNAELVQKPTQAPIPLESANGLSNQRGSIAMARTGVPDSATSQFFINVVDNPRLDHQPANPNPNGYAVFGRVVEGLEVVDRIRDQPTQPQGLHQHVPVKAVVIKKASLEK